MKPNSAKDDVDGVDANARTDVARGRGVVHRHVDRDDDGDDVAVVGANAMALPPSRGTCGRPSAALDSTRRSRKARNSRAISAYEQAAAKFESEWCEGHPRAIAARKAKAALESGAAPIQLSS
jgi:hypothetical protein